MIKNHWLDNVPLTDKEKQILTKMGWKFVADDCISAQPDYYYIVNGIKDIRQIVEWIKTEPEI
jgi:hypothetical protein